MKGIISLIKLQSFAPIARDLELAKKTEELENMAHLDGGLIILPKETPLTSRYCKIHDIKIIETNLRTLNELKKFYSSLENGEYAQASDTVHPILHEYMKNIIEKNKFTPLYFP
jgi:hypothetical protein